MKHEEEKQPEHIVMANDQELPDQICPQCGIKATYIADSPFGLPDVWRGDRTRHHTGGRDCLKQQLATSQAENKHFQTVINRIYLILKLVKGSKL